VAKPACHTIKSKSEQGTSNRRIFIMSQQLKTIHTKINIFTAFELTGIKFISVQILTPSDAVMIECRFGMESALSIFTITRMSALQPGNTIK
jgi:hypothetical protein